MQNTLHYNHSENQSALRTQTRWAFEFALQHADELSLTDLERSLRDQFGIICHTLRWLQQHAKPEVLTYQPRLICALSDVFLSAISADRSDTFEVSLRLIRDCSNMTLGAFRVSTNLKLARIPSAAISQWYNDEAPAMWIAPDFLEEEFQSPTHQKIGFVPTVPENLRLSASQRETMALLDGFLRIQEQKICVEGITSRYNPLITGPSGVGKTFTVRTFAGRHQLPFIDFNVASWVIYCARTEPHTLNQIANFVKTHERGVIFIDEVDKLGARTDWNLAVQQEIYTLLDGRMEGSKGWNEELAQKLRSNFLIIGAGTWQDLQPTRRKTLGFSNSANATSSAVPKLDLSTQTAIPEELLFRFNARIISLEPMTKDELGAKITTIYRVLKNRALDPARVDELATRAQESGTQHRWLEALVSHLAITNDPTDIEK